jgi:hypothetical protein
MKHFPPSTPSVCSLAVTEVLQQNTKQARHYCHIIRTFFVSRHQLQPDKCHNNGRNFHFDVMARLSSQEQSGDVTS